MSRIAIMGSGAWGTAIALSLASRGGHELTLWSHSPEVSEMITERGENTVFLPGFPVPKSIRATPNIEEALRDAEIVVRTIAQSFAAGRRQGLEIAKDWSDDDWRKAATAGVVGRSATATPETSQGECPFQDRAVRSST